MAVGSSLFVDNVNIQGKQANSLKLIDNKSFLREIRIENSTFNGINFISDQKFIDFGSVSSFIVQNCTFSDIKYSENLFSNTFLISIPSLDLTQNLHSAMIKIQITNTTVSLFEFRKFSGVPTQPSHLNICSNMSLRDPL
jgi:hypothetical protein